MAGNKRVCVSGVFKEDWIELFKGGQILVIFLFWCLYNKHI